MQYESVMRCIGGGLCIGSIISALLSGTVGAGLAAIAAAILYAASRPNPVEAPARTV